MDQNSMHQKVSPPGEIITDIISRLPVESVYQLQCLSKNFSSITKHRSFIDAHLKHSGRLLPSLIINSGLGILLIQYDILNSEFTTDEILLSDRLDDLGIINENLELLGSCSGLVVVQITDRDCILVNPITLEFDHLPNPSEIPSNYLRKDTWGFGYCAESKVYKTVRIPTCYGSNGKNSSFVAEVLTYGIDFAWRKVDFDEFDISYDDNGISVKGVVYWKPKCDQHVRDKLLTFDLEKEEFAWIFCPVSANGQMMEFSGSLAVCVKSEIKKNTFDLWVLKDKNSDGVCHAVNETSWEKNICY